MATFLLTDIVESSRFTMDVTLGKHFLLLCAHQPFSSDLKQALADWDFRSVECEGKAVIKKAAVTTKEPPVVKKPAQPSSPAPEPEQQPVPKPATPPTPPPPKVAAPVTATKFEEVTLEELDAAGKAPEQDLSVETFATIERIKNEHAAQDNEKSRMALVQEIYNEYTRYILRLFTHYATHRSLRLNDISTLTTALCAFIKENKRYVLRLTPHTSDDEKNFLITHSMRSTVIAIAIGLQLQMPQDKLVELGVASILHEIGQIRLPPQLYLTDRTLSASERAQMHTHPILSYNILKDNAFPLAISLAALEHHERENGSGYPRKLSGKKISVYAKIIGVACSFDAITAPRLHKEEQTTFTAMVEMLRNEEHKYDKTVVKALLYCLSLYPIGAYVYLSNGKIGVVTDVTPEQPMHPVVQLMNEKDDNGDPKTVQSDNAQMKIVRVLNKQEAEDLFITMQLDT